MADDGVEWTGSFEQMPSTEGPGDLSGEMCAFCGRRPAGTFLNLGDGSMARSWAVARWWALCQECVQTGHAGASALHERASEELRELPMLEEIVQLVINALPEVSDADQQRGR